MGVVGLVAFSLMWLRFLFIGGKYFFRRGNNIVYTSIKGLTLALLVLLIHSKVEDLPRRTPILYLTVIFWAYLAKGDTLVKKKRIEEIDDKDERVRNEV